MYAECLMPSYSRKFFQGFTFRFAVALLVVIVIVTTVSTILGIKHEYDRNTKLIQKTMATIESTDLKSLTEVLYNLDDAQIISQLSGMSRMSNVAYVEITTKDDVISQGTVDDDNNVFKKKFPLIYEYPNNPTLRNFSGLIDLST